MLARELGAQSPMELDEFTVSSADVELFLAFTSDSQNEFLQ